MLGYGVYRVVGSGEAGVVAVLSAAAGCDGVRQPARHRDARDDARTAALSGRIGKKRLTAGSYQLTLTPTDRARNTGKARTLRFQIVR